MAAHKLFKDEATKENGKRARMASYVGAMAIADLVKTTLGPKGMDKILQSTGRGHSVTVTNDGATMSLHKHNPSAKALVDISNVHDDEVGDGTTSVVVLAGELLKKAEKLVMEEAVDELAKKTPGKRSHAIEAFSRTLLAVPTIIADNAGLDSTELVAQLHAEHLKEGCTYGIDVITRSVGDIAELGISEAFKVK